MGRFTQPDTIIPDLTNPQALNRYSYVSNNPINLIDPTGHKMEGACGSGDRCYSGNDASIAKAKAAEAAAGAAAAAKKDICYYCHYQPKVNTSGGNPGGDTPGDVEEDLDVDWWEDPTTYDNIAAATQWAAYMLDWPGALFQAGSTGVGCTVGIGFGAPDGGVDGCIGGFLVGNALHMAYFNQIETALGFVSLAATVQSDLLTGETGWNDNYTVLTIGEDTATSLATTFAGTINVFAIGDLAIDYYGTKYAEGEARGIYELFRVQEGSTYDMGFYTLQFGN